MLQICQVDLASDRKLFVHNPLILSISLYPQFQCTLYICRVYDACFRNIFQNTILRIEYVICFHRTNHVPVFSLFITEGKGQRWGEGGSKLKM